MNLSPGSKLSHYEILELIGRGGMGAVYLAHDAKLGRNVAIKTLLKNDPERFHRFEREARAASALNHPNIVTVYEIGEAESAPFIVMEYVAGSTLRELIERGPIALEVAVGYAKQITGGLAKAHDAGIVHRDLKPENIIVDNNGFIKILDFGLAKLHEPDEPGSEISTLLRQTEPGTILGTAGYMSPEQARGELADYRSDQFSFGVILYELLTGIRVFERESEAQTLAAIIADEPEPITGLNRDVPPSLAAVIHKCLSKSPADRYDAIQDIERHLLPSARPTTSSRRTAVASGLLVLVAVAVIVLAVVSPFRESPGEPDARTIDSIAVLPLQNLSGDPEQEFLAVGMTEALITDLANVSELKVISRTSAVQAASTNLSIPEIGDVLNVDSIVEASVMRADDQVRISAKLIDARTDELLWAANYDRNLGDVLALMNDVARSIALEIDVAVTPAVLPPPRSPPKLSAEAQEVYLKARFFMGRLQSGDAQRARELFLEAIELEPEFASSHAGLAATEFLLGTLEGEPRELVRGRLRASVAKALSLDAENAEAHASRGLARLYFDWDWREAQRSLERAIALNPNDVLARHGLADLHMATGSVDESVRQLLLAKQADPLSIFVIVPLVGHLAAAERYDEAVAEARTALEILPGSRALHSFLAQSLWHQGEYEEALAELRAARGVDSPLVRAMTESYADGGPKAAKRAAARFLVSRYASGRISPIEIASNYASAGDADEAFEWLEKAITGRTPQLIHVPSDPDFKALRNDARFESILRRMNLPS